MSIYPNPTKYQFNVVLTKSAMQGETMEGELLIYSMNGKKIKSLTLNSEHNRYQINTENWATGIYLLRLIINGAEEERHKISIH